MSTAASTVPKHYDIRFLEQQADLLFYSRAETEEGIELRYPLDRAETMAAVIANYPVTYLPIALPRKLQQISQLRDEKIQSFKFNGLFIELTHATKTDINGLIEGLDKCPEIEEIDFSLGGGEFVTISRETAYELGKAVFRYIQACFSAHKRLATAAKAAADVDELEAIDLDAEWPSNEVDLA